MASDTTVKFKADISDLKAKMQQAARAVKVASSEFKAATAGMDDWTKSSEGLSAKLKQLDTVLDSQKKQLALSEQELEKTIKVYGENSAAADRVRIKINEQKAAIAQTEKQIDRYTKELDDCNKGLGKFASEESKTATATDKLRKTIDDQQDELDQLKKKYADVVLEQGKGSKEAKELASQIDDLSGELKENKDELDKAEKSADEFDRSLEDVDKSAKEAGDGFTVMKGVLADLAATAIRACVRGLGELAKATYEAGSNFEAGMSKVAAISGASADEMDQLTAKAKEMGETTKFSATESAEAFNYMAMAGWKTEDMLDGIEGIMSLAAASGEELGTTSDIVTDALTAFGYTAKDAAHFSDVLAAASSNANTNVAMMGESFKYAAPIAGSLGYSVEDVAVALGLMANSGIKGSMAGTSLRNILQRMANPTKEVASAMDRLGVSLDDGEGNMYTLMEIMEQLRDSFGEINMPVEEYQRRVDLLDSSLEAGLLTEKKYEEALEELNLETFGAEGAEKARAAAMLGGSRALSGLLAITETSEEDFEKLTKAIDNSTGAAKNMADTMNDNVQGQLTLLKSNIEGKMIRVFEKASDSIKRALQKISRGLDQIDWDKVADKVGELAEKAADLVDYLVNNGDKVVKVLKAIGTTLGTIFVVNKVSTFANSIKTLLPILSTLGQKFGLLTTAVSGAEGATLGLNAALLTNPLTWVAGGVIAGVANWEKYEKEVHANIEATYGLNDAQQELIDSINAEASSMQASIEERDQNVASIAGEYDNIRELKDEYDSLNARKNNLTDEEKARVDFIKTTLCEALNLEESELDDLIDKNTKLGDGIDKLIQKKQAEATLAAYDSSYAEAKANEKKFIDDVVNAQVEYLEAQERTKKAEEALAAATEDYNESVANAETGTQWLQSAMYDAQDAVREAKESEEAFAEALENANQSYIEAQTTIQNYEGLSSAIISNDSQKIQTELDNLTNGFITAGSATEEALQKQVDDFQAYYDKLVAAMEAGNPVVTQEMVDAAKENVDKAKAEYDKGVEPIGNAGLDASRQYCSSMVDNAGEAETAAEEVATSAETGFKTIEPMISAEGKTTAEGYNKSMKGQEKLSFQAGVGLGTQADSGMASKKSAINATGVSSGGEFVAGVGKKNTASKTAGTTLANEAKTGAADVDFSETGENAGSGFLEGIGRWLQKAIDKGRELAEAVIKGIKDRGEEGSPWKTTMRSGQYAGEGFEIGLQETIKSVVKSATALAADTLNALDEAGEFYKAGENSATSYVEGFKRYVGAVDLPSSEIGLNGRLASFTADSLSIGGAGAVKALPATQNVTFNQYNTSPKALDRLTIYRDTNSLLFNAKVRASANV